MVLYEITATNGDIIEVVTTQYEAARLVRYWQASSESYLKSLDPEDDTYSEVWHKSEATIDQQVGAIAQFLFRPGENLPNGVRLMQQTPYFEQYLCVAKAEKYPQPYTLR